VYAIKGRIKLKKSIIIKPTSVCPSVQKFYVHKFSDNYDFLLGQKFLEDTKAKIDYDNETATLGSKTFKFLYGEKRGETFKCLDPQQKDDFAPVLKINPKMQNVKTAPKCLKPRHQQQKNETALRKCLPSKVVVTQWTIL